MSRRPRPLGLRLIASIRFDEVLALQGAPLMGALLALPGVTLANAPMLVLTLGGLMLANGLLVSHVFMINDWAGIEGDGRDPNRSGRTFLSHQVTKGQIGLFCLLLLAASLGLFAALGIVPLALAIMIAGLSLLYSAPGLHLKGRPGLSTALHLIGGSLHFLLGFSVLAPLGLSTIAMASVFGLVFAAGHFTHEARDHDADAGNGIRTNAVAMGLKRGLMAGFVCFALAYALLFGLALTKTLPITLLVAGPVFLVHALAFKRLISQSISHARIKQLQKLYRLLFALIGLALLIGVICTKPLFPI